MSPQAVVIETALKRKKHRLVKCYFCTAGILIHLFAFEMCKRKEAARISCTADIPFWGMVFYQSHSCLP